jgi:hypothetical protein
VIINLRGPCASGKTTVIRALMHEYHACPLFGLFGRRRPEAYWLPFLTRDGIYVLGPYVARCGGCDALPSMASVVSLLDKYAPRGHVLFEGLLISGMYGRVGRALERYRQDALVAFLTTPLERCRAQLMKRQSEGRARGSASLAQHYARTLKVKQRMLRDGVLRVENLDPDCAVRQIEHWLSAYSTAAGALRRRA